MYELVQAAPSSKKAPAPAIWMERIGAPLVSSKVHETETVLISNTHAFFTRVGAT
jgi:hypothetical protein